ncbi:hypothetical protein [Methylobacterium nodulans]|uniref:hypothetical protein n=1 Tax=Methylobacterium nodulans TaxID=114616 RepID=UPI0002E81A2A|nr:hypothetical protein [Methylobacterium nodulans]
MGAGEGASVEAGACRWAGSAASVALDLAAVMLAHLYAREVLARENAPEAQRRMVVRTAILLARPI